jgi:GNAT superfamily N-acetyltransferase
VQHDLPQPDHVAPSGTLLRFSSMEKLTADHDVSRFRCGRDALDAFLRRHALPNQLLGSSTTFVSCMKETQRVAGFYSLVASYAGREDAPLYISDEMPFGYPIPVILLARLAVDRAYQGQKLGRKLLLDAMKRSVNAAEHVGVRALAVRALDIEARRYYVRWGFEPDPQQPLLLYLRMDVIRASLETGYGR